MEACGVVNTDLVPRSTVTEIVRAYTDACAIIRECHARLAAAEADINARLATVPGSRTGIRLPVVLPYGGHGDLDAQLMSLRLAVWSHLIDRLGIWRLCSTKRAEQLRAQLDPSAYRRRHYGDDAPEELPEITEDNVLGMVRGFASSLDTLLDESIREVFDLLRPRELGSAARYKRPGDPDVHDVSVCDDRRDAGGADHGDVYFAHGLVTVTVPERTVRVTRPGSIHLMYQR